MKNLRASILAWRLKTAGKGDRELSPCADMTGVRCSERARRRAGSFVIVAGLLFLMASMLAAAPCFADAVDIWMQTPDNWEDRKSGLGRDLMKQMLAPGGVAVIEVYGARGTNPGLQVIADRMEEQMLARGAAYLQTRLTDNRRRTADGHDAIVREYSGVHNGIPLRAIAVYTYGNGGAVAAFGFYAQNEGARYHNTVWASIGSIRFSPPGAAAAVTPTVTSAPHSAAASGCNAIIGTWKWFTGNKHAFGPNGTSSTAQVSWQCVDPQRRIVRINWSNGKYLDTLTISADGKRMEGKNQLGNRVWAVRHEGQAPAVQKTPAPVTTGSSQSGAVKMNPKCAPIVGTWRSEKNGQTVIVTADGRLNGNPRYTWSCHPDGVRYNFRWDDGARVVVWDDLRMDPDRMHLTQRQAGEVWDRFVKIR